MSATLPISAPVALEKRQKLLDIARKRMMHYGVAKTTMQDIAQDAGMAVGTIYLYFRNKDDIVLALGEACRNEQDQLRVGILEDKSLSPDEKLQQFFLAKFRYLESMRNDTPHGKALIRYFHERFPEELTQHIERFENAVAAILQQGIDYGAFKTMDVHATAHLLRLATAGFYMPPYLEWPRPLTEAELCSVLTWLSNQWQTETIG